MALTKIKTQSINDDAITTAKINNNAVTDAKVADDITAGAATTAATLATARSINGVSFNGSSAITVTADANTLSNTTLKSTVVTSSLTSVGTIGTGVWQGTAIASAYLDADTAHLSGSAFTGNVSVVNGVGGTAGVVTINNSSSDGLLELQRTTGTPSDEYVIGADSTRLYIRNNTTSSDIMTWLEGGNVGVGTTSPSTALHVVKDDTTNTGVTTLLTLGHSVSNTADDNIGGEILFLNEASDGNMKNTASIQSIMTNADEGDSTYDGVLQFRTINNKTFVDAMRISHDGKVGIGTTSPVNSKLCVQDSFSGTQASSEGVRFISAGDTTRYNWIENNISPGASLMGFFIDAGSDNTSTRVMTVHRSGVGIGVETPAHVLHISHATPVIRFDDTTNGILGYFGDASDFLTPGSPGADSFGLRSEGDLRFGTGGNELRMQIDNAGNFYQGPFQSMTSPNSTYTHSHIGAHSFLYRNAYDVYQLSNAYYNSSNQWIAKYSYAQGIGVLGMYGGNLVWDTYGDGAVTAGSDYGITQRFKVGYNGDVICSAHVYNNNIGGDTFRDFKIRSDGMTGVDTSSKRYKKKITDISDTSWIYDLRPVDFEWKKTDKKDWGLIAEEVIKVKPELVGVENDLPEWINYERLIPILLKEIQEQNKRIEILENA